jgi:CMP-N-acetylneuraminic acid synthetase/FMN phosphatase YigB (HAD superfamily)
MTDLDICAVIPVQQGGNDLIRNALIPFGEDNVPLIVWKIRQLKNVFVKKNIYVSSNSKEILSLALQEGVNTHFREKTLKEEAQGSFGDVISSIVKDLPHEHIAWVSAVIPFMGEYDYKKAISDYKLNIINGNYDSLMAVNKVCEYFWNDNGPINYNATEEQELRTELAPTYKVTNSLFIRCKKSILESRYFLGNNPFKFEVSKLAGLDINAQGDLDEAMALSSLFRKQENEKNKVIFLDFDGVIFDSVIEAYAMALLTAGKIKTLSELEVDSEHAKRFIAQRYLIGPAWNYYYLLKAIEEHHDEDFYDYLPSEAGVEAKNFQSAFFATRQVIRNNFWDAWLSLNKMYPGSDKFIELINKNKNIVIVTTKDAATVKALLDNYGLKRSIDIYDSKSYEKFGCKSYFMDDYIKRNKITSSFFIDDSMGHLDKCKWVTNLQVFQARWGYVAPEAYLDNKQEIFDIIEKELT